MGQPAQLSLDPLCPTQVSPLFGYLLVTNNYTESVLAFSFIAKQPPCLNSTPPYSPIKATPEAYYNETVGGV